MCLTTRSPYHFIYQALVQGRFELLTSLEILLEYEEVIQMKYGIATSGLFISLLKDLNNVEEVRSYYKWNLIYTDPDDNKYVDCAIAGKAEYIVTEDKHFVALKSVSFPKTTVIGIDDFLQVLK